LNVTPTGGYSIFARTAACPRVRTLCSRRRSPGWDYRRARITGFSRSRARSPISMKRRDSRRGTSAKRFNTAASTAAVCEPRRSDYECCNELEPHVDGLAALHRQIAGALESVDDLLLRGAVSDLDLRRAGRFGAATSGARHLDRHRRVNVERQPSDQLVYEAELGFNFRYAIGTLRH